MSILDKARNLLKSPATIVAATVVIVAAVLAGLIKFGFFKALIHNPWFPEIVVGIAVVLILFVIFVGLPWYRERSFVYRLGLGYGVGGEKSPQEFQAKFTAALSRFRNLPQNADKKDATYALPWFLIIGAAASGKTGAVKSSGIFSLLTASSTMDVTQNFDWWVSNSMLLLDTAGRYTLPADGERDRSEWYRLLRLIKHYHGREPLSGVIVTAAANYLASQPDDQLRADAGESRIRIEEAVQELGAEFPVYLLVTKCDLLESFVEFFGTLPSRVLNQAVGWIDDPPPGIGGGPPRGAPALKRLQDGLSSTYQRLNVIGTSVLNGVVTEQMRQPLFCFPEEFRALSSRLAIFAEPLASEDVRYHTPLLRGIFFSSALQEESQYSFLRHDVGIMSRPPAVAGKTVSFYFLRDVFELILPRDRGLASIAASKG